MQGGQRKADRPLASAFRLIGFGDGLVKRGFNLREFLVDCVRLALGEQRRAVEFPEFFLDHATHEVGGIEPYALRRGISRRSDPSPKAT